MDPCKDVSQSPVSMGTSIIAVAYDKGVILGADTRTSSGNYIGNRATDKLTPLASNVYLLRSGSAADTQAIATYVQYYIAQHQSESNCEVKTCTAARMCQQMAYNNKDNLQAGMIVAGWDKEFGPSVWGVPLGGSLLQVPYATGGSGSAYIYGFCDKYFKPNMTETECKSFVRRALMFAMARDASSGGSMRTVTIDGFGTRRDFLPGENIPAGYGELPVPASVPERLFA